ncbi:trimeric intracellular cation channel family protein [Paramagnetospirillum magneticum]|uniref:Predicted membrane protein n=1 Tax=Paramagnetospirillum magneticum (strain ATCC 700264 / AMB-1) TaxID=342108 RepID=Q2W5X7_PARM1|nr:TRIC cation channel family protein [Paramagnetospirillum magneticum]BAE50748.1 Predicted membrane protein [Paramagnetospirillum magneticum AMB-1]
MLIGQFTLPLAFDLAATFLFALTGALTAMRKGYDFVGVFFLALVTGIGGGLLRDGLFLQQVPAVLGSHYLLAVVVATVIGLVFGQSLNRLALVFLLVDALGLGLYTVFGAQKALNAGLGWIPALLIGVINAVGGGVLRDLMSREDPLIFRPGEFYAAASLAGGMVFAVLALGMGLAAQLAALAGIGVTVLVRVASVRFGWRTPAARALIGRDQPPGEA